MMKIKIFTILLLAAIPAFAQSADIGNDRLEASRDRFDAEGGREFLALDAKGERARLARSNIVRTDMGRDEADDGHVEDATLERNHITTDSGGYELSPDATFARENLVPERYMRVRASEEFRFEGVKLLPEFRFDGFELLDAPLYLPEMRFDDSLLAAFTPDSLLLEIAEETRLALLYPLAKKYTGTINSFSYLGWLKEDYEYGLITREEYLKELNENLEQAKRK